MWYGILYFAISISLFPLFGVVMKVLHSKTLHHPNTTYSLMNLILLTELIQVTCHFVTSPIFIFPELQIELDSVVRIFGNILNTFWIFEFPATTLLAVYRVLIFTDLLKSQKMPAILKAFIFLITTLLITMSIFCYQTQSFISSPPGWKYDQDAPYTPIFELLEVLIVFPCLTINYISYILIAFLIYKVCDKPYHSLIQVQKKRGSTVHSRKNELEILIQYTLLTIYTTVSIIAWHKGELWFDMGDACIQAIINALWILGCALNPILTLVLSRSIRNQCLQMIQKHPIDEVVALSGNHLFATFHHH